MRGQDRTGAVAPSSQARKRGKGRRKGTRPSRRVLLVEQLQVGRRGGWAWPVVAKGKPPAPEPLCSCSARFDSSQSPSSGWQRVGAPSDQPTTGPRRNPFASQHTKKSPLRNPSRASCVARRRPRPFDRAGARIGLLCEEDPCRKRTARPTVEGTASNPGYGAVPNNDQLKSRGKTVLHDPGGLALPCVPDTRLTAVVQCEAPVLHTSPLVGFPQSVHTECRIMAS